MIKKKSIILFLAAILCVSSLCSYERINVNDTPTTAYEEVDDEGCPYPHYDGYVWRCEMWHVMGEDGILHDQPHWTLRPFGNEHNWNAFKYCCYHFDVPQNSERDEFYVFCYDMQTMKTFPILLNKGNDYTAFFPEDGYYVFFDGGFVWDIGNDKCLNFGSPTPLYVGDYEKLADNTLIQADDVWCFLPTHHTIDGNPDEPAFTCYTTQLMEVLDTVNTDLYKGYPHVLLGAEFDPDDYDIEYDGKYVEVAKEMAKNKKNDTKDETEDEKSKSETQAPENDPNTEEDKGLFMRFLDNSKFVLIAIAVAGIAFLIVKKVKKNKGKTDER